MLQADAREYQLEFFRRMGFKRKKCPRCGSYFWTLNEEQEHCNDAPCVEYYFWKIPRVKGLTVRDARRKFIEFFRRKGHEYIKPRPVVARWREDLYLTIASIVVFQPHVTSGIVPPPANPLVIVQPCIRLEDIDFVGLTMGRHLTSFEMGGHHVFNYPDRNIYWKEETVEYAFEFFTKELGIPPEMITFKESWWEGGGNAGPSFEVTVGGLELATLVFMKYRVVDGRYEPMNMRIVDTGYGIERIAWFSQDKPTSFHAVYGPLLEEFRRKIGVEEPPHEILWAAVRAAGRLDPEDENSIGLFYERVARETGLGIDDVRSILEREAQLYALLDHTKTIALMLGDGIVPSNTGEGYLARLVIRRALRILRKLNTDVQLGELVTLQAKYWGNDYYPRMLENLDYIVKVVSIEEERYKRALERGLREIERLLRRKKRLTLDDLILLYDSHGIPPDMVREVAVRLGVGVSVPHNFYAIVARKHGASGTIRGSVEERPRLPREVEEWARKLPPTRRLFHEDPYLREFTARLAGVKGRYVVLDATAFYPTGGGQLHDTGVLEVCGEKYNVIGVEKVGDVIVHILDREVKCDEGRARGLIDWERRYKLMRHHTGVHVLLGALRRVLGSHVWQAGAEKTPEKARLDVTHYELPSKEQVRRIEELANKAILERIPVEAKTMDRNLAEELYGFQLYQGGVPLSREIRVVKIGDWDVEACFGTHVANTAEIGSIKIINVDKIQDGVIRFEIVAGTQVANYALQLEETLGELAERVGGGKGDIVKRVEKILEELRKAKQQASTLRRLVSKLLIKAATVKQFGAARIYVLPSMVSDTETYKEAMLEIARKDNSSIAITVIERNGDLLVEIGVGSQVAEKLDVKKLVATLREKGFRGGGKPSHLTFYGKGLAGKKDELLKEVIEAVQEALTGGG